MSDYLWLATGQAILSPNPDKAVEYFERIRALLLREDEAVYLAMLQTFIGMQSGDMTNEAFIFRDTKYAMLAYLTEAITTEARAYFECFSEHPDLYMLTNAIAWTFRDGCKDIPLADEWFVETRENMKNFSPSDRIEYYLALQNTGIPGKLH